MLLARAGAWLAVSLPEVCHFSSAAETENSSGRGMLPLWRVQGTRFELHSDLLQGSVNFGGGV